MIGDDAGDLVVDRLGALDGVAGVEVVAEQDRVERDDLPVYARVVHAGEPLLDRRPVCRPAHRHPVVTRHDLGATQGIGLDPGSKPVGAFLGGGDGRPGEEVGMDVDHRTMFDIRHAGVPVQAASSLSMFPPRISRRSGWVYHKRVQRKRAALLSCPGLPTSPNCRARPKENPRRRRLLTNARKESSGDVARRRRNVSRCPCPRRVRGYRHRDRIPVEDQLRPGPRMASALCSSTTVCVRTHEATLKTWRRRARSTTPARRS